MSYKSLILLLLCINILIANEPSADKLKIGIIYVNAKNNDSFSLLLPLIEFFTDPNIKAILLMLEQSDSSDGGSKIGQAFMQEIIALKQIYKKPVIAYAEGSMSIENYLFALSSDLIVASPFTVVGRMGLQLNTLHKDKKNAKDGTVLNLNYSGKYKYLFESNLPAQEEHIKLKQKNIDRLFELIVADVFKYRPQLINTFDQWKNGEAFIATSQLGSMFIDKTGDRLDAVNYALRLAGTRSIMHPELEFIEKMPKIEEKEDLKATQLDDIKDDVVKNNKINIAVLRINEIELASWHYDKAINELFQNPRYAAVILCITCSGAPASIGYNIHSQINKLKAIYNKPVVAYIDRIAYSMGYCIASAADYIVMAPGASVGSIGIRHERWDFTKKNEQDLCDYYEVVTGSLVNAYDKNTQLTAPAKAMMQAIMDSSHELFIDIIKQARPIAAEYKSQWCESQIFTSSDALCIGLVDKIGTPLEAISLALGDNCDLANISFSFSTLPKKTKDN